MANEAEFQSADLSADEGGRDSPALDTVHTINHHGTLQRTSSTSDEYICYISDPKNTEKKFPIDRKKLERLILVGGYGKDSAEQYFMHIMEETGTLILWPSKLKVGAKSKKDPHVKVVGRPEAIQKAREIILTDLDAKSSRITLKIDIPFSEHSHVIGKEGVNIKRVHEESKCHIHFPDSNRTMRRGEKSNQVSITGAVPGVEIARQKIRELLPLVIKFITPLPGDLDVKALNMREMMAPYNVMVHLKPQPNSCSLHVTMKGMVCYQQGLKLAINKLLEYFTESSHASSIPVELHMELATQHHHTVIGTGAINLNKITQETSTMIEFPDPLSKVQSTVVIIRGGIDEVLMARQRLIGCLPVVLLFDVHETEEETISSSVIGQLSSELDVFVSVRPKAKQPVQSVIIKSIEQNIQCVYEARARLLEQANQPVKFVEQANQPVRFVEQANQPVRFAEQANQSVRFVEQANQPVRFVEQANQPVRFVEPESFDCVQPNEVFSDPLDDPSDPPTGHAPTGHTPTGHTPDPTEGQALAHQSPSSVPSSSHQLAPSTTPSPSQEATGGLKAENSVEVHVMPSSCSSVPTALDSTARPPDSVPHRDSSPSLTLSSSHLGGFPSKRPTTREFLTYEQRKEEAQKAMKAKVEPSAPRVPTEKWSGNGFSQSWHPNITPTATRPESPKGLSSLHKAAFQALADQATLQRTAFAQVEQDRYHGVTDLSDLLKLLELEKYKENFEKQEVDFTTFLTMTEEDLKEIGVSTLGARRKLQIAISEIKRLRSQPQPTNIVTSRGFRPQQQLPPATSRVMSMGRMATMGRGVSQSMKM